MLAIVRELTGDAGAELRWRVALRGIDLLFDDLGLTLEQKRDIARRAQHGYGREFGADGAFQHEVSRLYRRERAAVEALLDPAREPPAELAASIQALHQRSAALARPTRELRAVAEAGRLTVELPELAMSLAHMHVNRMLRSAQRAQELVIYELLGRAYSSQAARPQAARSQAARSQAGAAPVSDWDAVIGEAALGLDLARVDAPRNRPGLALARRAVAVLDHRPDTGPGTEPADADPRPGTGPGTRPRPDARPSLKLAGRPEPIAIDPDAIFREEALEFRARGRDVPGGVVRLGSHWLTWAYRVTLALLAAAIASMWVIRTSESTSGPVALDGRTGRWPS